MYNVNQTSEINIEVAAASVVVGRAQSSHLISSKTIRSRSVISSVQSTNDHRRSLYMYTCSLRGKGSSCEAYRSENPDDESLYKESDELMNQSLELAAVA